MTVHDQGWSIPELGAVKYSQVPVSDMGFCSKPFPAGLRQSRVPALGPSMTALPPTAVTGKPPMDQVLLHCIPGGSSLVCKKQKDLMNTNSNLNLSDGAD